MNRSPILAYSKGKVNPQRLADNGGLLYIDGMTPTPSTTILAIETSCDETAVSIVRKTGDDTVVLSSVVSSQIALHAPFGGVVPDLAAREHAKNILPVLKEALAEAGVSKDDLDAIAVTQGPGLIPALLIGTAAAKTLAYAWKKPLLGIHHIEGHIYANFISIEKQAAEATISYSHRSQGSAQKSLSDKNELMETSGSNLFPLLALVVSGGHTQLVLMRDHFRYEILGETQDDAAGEAFDKVAKMLGLPYPGGPVVAKRADTFANEAPLSEREVSEKRFPRPMIHSGNFDFSFSGLKTAVLYAIKKSPEKIGDENFMNEICHGFQEAVIDTLVTKTRRAIETFHPKTFVIAGGVSANVSLRSRLADMIATDFPRTRFMLPEFAYSLDNAAMIAAAAAFRWEHMSENERSQTNDGWKTVVADANLMLQDLG